MCVCGRLFSFFFRSVAAVILRMGTPYEKRSRPKRARERVGLPPAAGQQPPPAAGQQLPPAAGQQLTPLGSGVHGTCVPALGMNLGGGRGDKTLRTARCYLASRLLTIERRLAKSLLLIACLAESSAATATTALTAFTALPVHWAPEVDPLGGGKLEKSMCIHAMSVKSFRIWSTSLTFQLRALNWIHLAPIWTFHMGKVTARREEAESEVEGGPRAPNR